MKRLIINNFGPIKHVELDLKLVNVITGPQSVGKSCILKLACFCAWAEKRIEVEQDSKNIFIEDDLVTFHKLDDFVSKGEKASFSYETNTMKFSYDFDTEDFQFKWKSGHWKYKRSRITYIPSERNIIAVIPNLLDVSFGNNYVKNFISDWNLTHALVTPNMPLELLNLDMKYYFDKSKGGDRIILSSGKEIAFSNSSSGLQSIIPMMVYLNYLFHYQYTSKGVSSIRYDSENDDILHHIYTSRYKGSEKKPVSAANPIFKRIGSLTLKFNSIEESEECARLYNAFTKTTSSDIYLEEPELNLFPQTQTELVYWLLSSIKEHGDSLFVATHSPYILYAINNCLLGGLVGNKVDKDNLLARINEHSWINPKDVAVWELKEDADHASLGNTCLPIQDEDGLVRSNYFDRIMKNIMSEFSNLMAYYD